MRAVDDRDIELHLTVTEFGASKMLRATSQQLPNLIVTGTDDSDLWKCLNPVITSLLQAQGEDVRSISLDRSNGLRDIRVHVKVAATSDREPVSRPNQSSGVDPTRTVER